MAVVSLCVGAFLLAEAGLVDRRRATTSWLHAGELARRCPNTDVRPEQLVVTDTAVTTTAAFSAMYDLALDLIHRHNGIRVARATTRLALLDDARTSQTPYVAAQLLPQPGREFSQQVMRQLDQNLAELYDLAALAGTFQVSTAHCCAASPKRPDTAPWPICRPPGSAAPAISWRPADHTVAAIAGAVGYQDPGTLAALFARHTGQRPSTYRATFHRTPRA
ncbi:DJ-1/PfpI family protein [Streptomyces sp. NPDC001393]